MKNKGFTLIELVLVITMLGILLGITIMIMDPRKQLSRVDDASRKQDIQELKTALDTYYNDHNCYPTALPYGSIWQENNAVYMRKVPQDLSCAGNTNCYVYKYNGSCPQWNVVFTKLSNTPPTSQCTLTKLSACVPTDYDNSWACIVSGNVDTTGCGHISSTSLASGSDGGMGSSGQGNGGTGGNGGGNVCSKDYTCSNNQCNHIGGNLGEYCDGSCDGNCVGR